MRGDGTPVTEGEGTPVTADDGTPVSRATDVDGTPVSRVATDVAVAEIRDLRVENAPQDSSLRFITCLYDSAGRRTVLPFVNDRCVPDLPAETEFLRGVLASGRGVA